MSRWQVVNGECREVMATMADCSVDAVVTDPPAGISFMGKHWDRDHGGRDEWVAHMTDIFREMVRVMKPGAHAVVWAIPRTSHWTALALEDAGLEVRDVVVHLFGTGFPKSLDVSKAIDKAAGEKDTLGDPKSAAHAGWIKRGRMRGEDGHDGYQRPWMQDSEAVDANARQYIPATDAARQWQGWGTSLKPASEHWILCRKPLAEKTVAANVVKHGTGAMNVDGCRVEGVPPSVPQPSFNSPTGKVYGFKAGEGRNGEMSAAPGRWPANLVLDETAAQLLDEQSGDLTSGANPRRRGADGDRLVLGAFAGQATCNAPRGIDTGGASRFFYCAKASRAERGEGNNHPTVKPIALMRWLCRLITPPGGTVLDPFAGSGSTLIAATREGFAAIGIEQDSAYADLARQRIRDDNPILNHAAEDAAIGIAQ